MIEAKAWGKPYTEGVGQAKSYAAKLAVRFSYAANGQAIYGSDIVTGAEGDVAQYPSPEELGLNGLELPLSTIDPLSQAATLCGYAPDVCDPPNSGAGPGSSER